MGILEKIKAIEEEMARTQKNKATEGHLGILKARLAKLRTQLVEGPKGTQRTGDGFDVQKTGDARVAMIGFPSVGKSTLLSTVTKTESSVASYEFTTLTCIPGMIEYKDSKIQLLDLPGIIEGASKGKGRGRQVIGVARSSDMVLMMLDASKAELQKRLLTKELEDVNIRINKPRPDIAFKVKKQGGLKINQTVPLTKTDDKTIRNVLSSYKVHNADIVFRGDYGIDELIDVIEGNRKYMRCLFVINKIDTITLDEIDRLAREPHTVVVSCNWKLNIAGLLDSIWEHLDFIRVFTKAKGRRPDFTEPVILPRGSTVMSVCGTIHQDFKNKFKYAMVWGTSARHAPQRVGLHHPLQDEDVVQLYTK